MTIDVCVRILFPSLNLRVISAITPARVSFLTDIEPLTTFPFGGFLLLLFCMFIVGGLHLIVIEYIRES
jgi:hypothetical protein